MGSDMNYKIKVANEVKSKEVQELFFQLGGVLIDSKDFYENTDAKAVCLINNYILLNDISFESCDDALKEITIPELRDLVVLKRNDVGDATHENTVTGSKVLQLGGKNYYWQDGKWNEYPCGVDIKPIEKKEMKEYLRKNSNGSYSYIGYVHADHVSDSMIEITEGDTWAYKNSRGNIITMHGKVCQAFIGDLVWERESMKENKITKDYLEKQADGSYVMKSGFAFKDAGWIEIPEGADIAACNQLSKKITFFKDSGYSQLDEGKWHKCGIEVDGIKYHDIGEFLSFGNGAQILWQRESPNDKLASAEQYRQAEVLPFIDDEPKSAWDTQVGGDHYKKYKIQPMLFALENNLNPLQHSVLKYIMRHEDKNGKQDLEKAKHYIDLMIAHYYPAE